MKRLLLILPLCFLFMIPTEKANAQFDGVGEILRSGANDSNLLLESYLRPYASGFAADLNTGWNNNARPYRTLGFDLRVNVPLAFIPSTDELFDVSQLNFNELELLDGPSITPTAAGPDDVARSTLGATFQNPQTGNQEELFSFDMPQGSGLPYVPAAMIQASVGVPYDSEVSLRALPTISIPETDGEFNLFGFGVKHGLNQWIPGGAVLPVDISAQFGYTRMSVDIPVEVDPESGGDIRDDNPPSTWDGQAIELNSSGYTFNLLVGKTLPIISVFGGVGFQDSNLSITTEGSYPITKPNTEYDGQTDTRTRAIDALEAPIDLNFDSANSVHALAGFRVRLAILTISGSYTISNYPVANLGVGLSFR